jgi:3-phenylpropionate/trans-cinnamate dioxygenase ferredoxin reductase subunit
MEIDSIVIVGAGAAGQQAAHTLREEGYRGSVVMIGEEPELPYERPPLSKGYLMGDEERDSAFFEPQSWFEEHDVEVRSGVAAVAIDRIARAVALEDGSQVGYDRLLIATGARARTLDIEGSNLPGVITLRTLADADRLRALLSQAKRMAIIGGGWIGLEVASAARTAGVEVTVLESAELPLVGVLGPRVAEIFADLHRRHGVDLRCGVEVRRLLGSSDGVTGVDLGDGAVVDADLVLIGVGAVPNVELAEAAGLAVGNGIEVDETLRTDDPSIWAAGDVAAAAHQQFGRRIRVEHIENALAQGSVAARAMLGGQDRYNDLPFFYTDQYDLGMEYVGAVAPGSDPEVVIRGDVAGLEFMVFWVVGGTVAAGMHVNVWDSTDDIRHLVASQRQVHLSRLADPDVPLQDV